MSWTPDNNRRPSQLRPRWGKRPVRIDRALSLAFGGLSCAAVLGAGVWLANDWARYAHAELTSPTDYVNAIASAVEDKSYLAGLGNRLGLGSSSAPPPASTRISPFARAMGGHPSGAGQPSAPIRTTVADQGMPLCPLPITDRPANKDYPCIVRLKVRASFIIGEGPNWKYDSYWNPGTEVKVTGNPVENVVHVWNVPVEVNGTSGWMPRYYLNGTETGGPEAVRVTAPEQADADDVKVAAAIDSAPDAVELYCVSPADRDLITLSEVMRGITVSNNHLPGYTRPILDGRVVIYGNQKSIDAVTFTPSEVLITSDVNSMHSTFELNRKSLDMVITALGIPAYFHCESR